MCRACPEWHRRYEIARSSEPLQGSGIRWFPEPRVAATRQPWAMEDNLFEVIPIQVTSARLEHQREPGPPCPVPLGPSIRNKSSPVGRPRHPPTPALKGLQKLAGGRAKRHPRDTAPKRTSTPNGVPERVPRAHDRGGIQISLSQTTFRPGGRSFHPTRPRPQPLLSTLSLRPDISCNMPCVRRSPSPDGMGR